MGKLIHTLSELDAEAERFVSELVPKEDKATLILLSGELGAGKTAFTKAVAHSLGIDEVVNSPTFVLEKIYQLGSEASKFKHLVHIDAYRLESGSDLINICFEELMNDAGNLILLEWPEKVSDMLPDTATHISISSLPDSSRTISYG